MSIEICEKCARFVDTDFDVETIVYQKNKPLCIDCAIPQCYEISIRDFNSSHKNAWKMFYIKALTQDEAIEIFSENHIIDNYETDFRIEHAGKWSSFEQMLD